MTFFPRTQSPTPGAFAIQGGAEPSPGYRLRRIRGRGGFAEVWEADSPSGVPVALKFMPSANTGTTVRELRSIQQLQAMDHPYLVKTHGVWSVPGYIVIAMELADATLLDLLQVYHNELGQYIDPPQLLLSIWQVAEALDFLNTRQHTLDGRKVGFQHGDVKPNNVLLFGDTAKLTDYGLATPTNGPTTPCPRHGTRDYAAPEVFQGYLTDSSDQYSLAVTYYVLRTGRFPFPSPPPTQSKSCLRPAPELPGVLPDEQAALSRALAVVPQARFPSCLELTRALFKAHGMKLARTEETGWRVVPDEETMVDGPKGSGRQQRPPQRGPR